jgi:hypothetical protein
MTRRLTWLLALSALLALALAPTAMAKSKRSWVKLSGGTTTVQLDAAAATALDGVTITPRKPARAKGGGYAFKITNGRALTNLRAGYLRHAGALVLEKGEAKLTIRNPQIVFVGSFARLRARVGGQFRPIAKIDRSGASIERSGRRVTVTGLKLTLTKVAADALNATFGTTLAENATLGTATVKTRIVGKVHRFRGENKGGDDQYADPFDNHKKKGKRQRARR